MSRINAPYKRSSINPSEFKHRISIDQLTLTPDGMGGSTEGWSELKKRWAKIQAMTSGQSYFASKLEHRITHKITMYYTADITTEKRIRYEGRVFHIHGVIDPDEAHVWLILECEEGVPS